MEKGGEKVNYMQNKKIKIRNINGKGGMLKMKMWKNTTDKRVNVENKPVKICMWKKANEVNAKI